MSATQSAQDVYDVVCIDKWINDAKRDFGSLFLLYATAHHFKTGLVTTNYGVGRLCQQSARQMKVDRSKIALRIKALSQAIISKVGFKKYNSRRKSIRKRFSKLDIFKLISGKDYLIPLLLSRFKKTANFGGNTDQFKLLLASYFDLSYEKGLHKFLKSA